MDREELLSLLVTAILNKRVAGRPVKVAIDGRSAAGKSTLADELGTRLGDLGLPVVRPSIDGFHNPRERRHRQGEYSAQGYYEDAYDYEAVIEHLLKPLSGTTFPVPCRQVSLDFRTNLPVDAPPVTVAAAAILLFEGIFVLRRELNSFWDLRILVATDPAIARSRAQVRDTGVLGPADFVQRKYEVRYDPAWVLYEKLEHPASKADIVIDNSDPSRPRIQNPA